MLPRANRLRRSADFHRVVRRGRRASSATIVVHAAPGAGPRTGTQVGFVVSKAVGDAVTRNRVKRRLRHAIRPRLASLDDLMLVIRANPAASSAAFPDLSGDLERCLAKVESSRR